MAQDPPPDAQNAAERPTATDSEASAPAEAANQQDADQAESSTGDDAATAAQVAALVDVVRAEPPIHERETPWDVPVSELILEMQPLTLEEIEERLGAWQAILKAQVRIRIRHDILLDNPKKLESAKGTLGAQVDEAIKPADLKAVLAARSQEQQQIIEAIVAHMRAAIDLIEKRGGDATKFKNYIAAATGQRINFFDTEVLLAQITAWLRSPSGGIAIGLNVLKFIAVLIAFWFASILIGGLISATVGRIPKASSLLKPLLVNTTRRAVMVIGLITAIAMLGVNPGPLLAMVGAAGLVIGLALQGTLSNFASGILILINRPYDVGDVINAGGVVGTVEAMNLVSTRVLTFDNQVMFVPNNQIWNGVITNVTGRNTRRVDLLFGIGYSDDIASALQILEDTINSNPKVLRDPAAVIRVHELGDNSVNIVARPWCSTRDYWDVYWDLTREVKQRFDAAGINIPFPQRDLHLPGPIEVVMAQK